MIRRRFLRGAAGAALAAGLPAAFAQVTKESIVIQVSDDNPKTWSQALNVVRNIQADRGKDNVTIEVVVFGDGVGMLKLDSPLANRIDEALAAGAGVLMCRNTMANRKLGEQDMLPRIGYVKSGVIELLDRQKQGWAVIRP